MTTVGLVGAGFHFEILLSLFEATSTRVLLWQPGEDEKTRPADLPDHVELVDREAMSDVPLIFFCVPIDVCRAVARDLGNVMSGRHVIVHTSRSLEPMSLKSISTILQEETPTQRFGFLTGPVLLQDVKAGLPSSGVCASLFPEVHDLVEDCLMSPIFRLYRTTDITGAEISAAYGRVIALIAGLSKALDLGTSLQATLFARGLAEMARFVVFREGFERTAFGLSGAGNLYADMHLEGSIDFQMGMFLAKNKKPAAAAIREKFGWRAEDLLNLLDALHDVAETASLDVHLLAGAHGIVSGRGIKDAIEDLMNLPALYE